MKVDTQKMENMMHRLERAAGALRTLVDEIDQEIMILEAELNDDEDVLQIKQNVKELEKGCLALSYINSVLLMIIGLYIQSEQEIVSCYNEEIQLYHREEFVQNRGLISLEKEPEIVQYIHDIFRRE